MAFIQRINCNLKWTKVSSINCNLMLLHRTVRIRSRSATRASPPPARAGGRSGPGGHRRPAPAAAPTPVAPMALPSIVVVPSPTSSGDGSARLPDSAPPSPSPSSSPSLFQAISFSPSPSSSPSSSPLSYADAVRQPPPARPASPVAVAAALPASSVTVAVARPASPAATALFAPLVAEAPRASRPKAAIFAGILGAAPAPAAAPTPPAAESASQARAAQKLAPAGATSSQAAALSRASVSRAAPSKAAPSRASQAAQARAAALQAASASLTAPSRAVLLRPAAATSSAPSAAPAGAALSRAAAVENGWQPGRRRRRPRPSSRRETAATPPRRDGIPPELVDLCLKCLSTTHRIATCRLPVRCRRCKGLGHIARECKRPHSPGSSSDSQRHVRPRCSTSPSDVTPTASQVSTPVGSPVAALAPSPPPLGAMSLGLDAPWPPSPVMCLIKRSSLLEEEEGRLRHALFARVCGLDMSLSAGEAATAMSAALHIPVCRFSVHPALPDHFLQLRRRGPRAFAFSDSGFFLPAPPPALVAVGVGLPAPPDGSCPARPRGVAGARPERVRGGGGHCAMPAHLSGHRPRAARRLPAPPGFSLGVGPCPHPARVHPPHPRAGGSGCPASPASLSGRHPGSCH